MRELVDILNQRSMDFSTLNQEHLLDLAFYHRVTGLIQVALKDYKDTPPQLHDMLKKAQQKNSQYALNQLQSMILVKNAFEQENIPYLVLKGLPLSQELYGNMARRQSTDIDFLIAPVHLQAADSVLRRLGFVPRPDVLLTEGTIKKLLLSHHDITYFHPRSMFRFELHFQIDNSYGLIMNFDTLWQNRRSIDIMQHSFNVLSKLHQWIYLCSHGSKHAWVRLQWVCDIAQYQRFHLPEPGDEFWAKAEAIAKACHIEKQYQLALNISEHYFPQKQTSAVQYPLKHITGRLGQIYQAAGLANIRTDKIRFDYRLYQKWFLWQLTSCSKHKVELFLNPPRAHFWQAWSRKIPTRLFWLCYPAYALKGLVMAIIIPARKLLASGT